MITLDGADLIAQVYLVAILILAVERRAIGPVPYPNPRTVGAQVRWWTGYIALGVTLVAALLSVALCVVAVASAIPLDGAGAVFVSLTGLALVLLVVGQVVPLGMRAYAGSTGVD